MLRIQREAVDAGIKYNQSLPPNERVMFNADLLRHITEMIPTPLKEATAFAKEHQDTTYVYWKEGLKEGQSINFIQTIQYLINSLEGKEKGRIYDQFRAQEEGAYTDDIDDAFETLYEFCKLLQITNFIDFGRFYPKSLDITKQIFGADEVYDEVQRYIDYFNEHNDEDREEDFDESEFECKIGTIDVIATDDKKGYTEALLKLKEVLKRLTPKAKGKGK